MLKCACAPSVIRRRKFEGVAAVLHQADMVEPRIVADRDDQRVVDLIGLRAVGRDEALDQRRAGILAEPQQRAREHRRGRGAARDMNDMQRLRQHDAVGDLDHDAVGHHRAVERDHRIGVVEREQLRLQRGVAGLQHFAQRADGKPLLQPVQFGKLRREHAVHQHQPAHALDRLQLHGRCSPLQRGRIRRRRQRQHLAHQRAQIGVFPVLDPPVRQARTLIGLERRASRLGDLAGARQPVARDGEAVAQRASGLGLCQSNIHHESLVRPRLRTGRSRKPRAPAPVPCRRFSRPGPSTSRARSRARCSSAAAGSG